ncbi:Thioesterase domain-containing protein [Sphingomonas antarctica]|uniref:PaaI family thioesterase n=1 Tax=Sphingomonas antarctica TaxID=2040274 RepID=UPI0039EC7F5A
MSQEPNPPGVTLDRAFDPSRFIAGMARSGHNGMIGTRYRAHGPDWVELELPYDERLIGDPATGVLASGPVITLMDMVTSISIWLKSGKFRPQATLDLRVDYLRPAEPGKTITGRGECYKLGKSIAFIRGEAHDGDPSRPIAHASGTYIFTDV